MTKKNVPEGDHPIASDRSMAKWIAIGFAFGVIVGNIALWTLFGVAIGAALGADSDEDISSGAVS